MGRPYQPSLLRLLHAGTALLVAAAWLSGALVFLSADRRGLDRIWSAIAAPAGDWIDIHGTAGVVLLPVAVLLTAYALTLGRARLRRWANALPLSALVLAIGSGKLMDEDWLRQGVLDHPLYAVHLLAWILLGLSVGFHLVGAFRIGGLPLLSSMLRLELRPGDRPGQWPTQIQRWLQR
jgi:hypothetical protein